MRPRRRLAAGAVHVSDINSVRALVCIPLFCSLGCYTYVAPRGDPRLVGNAVHLSLTDSGTTVLTPLVGTAPRTVEGRLTADSGATYVVRVTKLVRVDGMELRRSGEQMLIPHSLVANVGTRSFSPRRTVAFVAVTAVAVATIAEAVAHQFNHGSASGTGGRPTPY
jgi:hypothetical protein